jgi:hypothetical protein
MSRTRPLSKAAAHMTRIIPHRRESFLTLAIFLLMTVWSYGETILSLTFDDPNGALASYPDGISVVDFRGDPMIGESAIASGFGGKAQVKVESGEWAEDGSEPPKTLQLMTDSAMETKAFVRLLNNKQFAEMRGNVIATPDGRETSLASLSHLENGKLILNGGLDMFFRYSEENPSQQELVPNLLSLMGDGIRIIVESDGGTIVASFSDGKDEASFDTDLDGTADASRVQTSSVKAAPIDPDTAYHLAISFQTAETGVITAKVFVKPGVSAINSSEDTDLVSMAEFSIITADNEKSLKDGDFPIKADSRTSPQVAVLDLAAFRIFKPAPAIFPDISGKE